jgi:hypothetical protein
MSADDRGGFCGWLDMRVKLGWQARWCEVSVDTCTFARSHKKFDQSGRKMTKLLGISVRLISESKSGKRFVIESVRGEQAEPIEMKASSKGEAEDWVRAIHEVQSRHGGGGSTGGARSAAGYALPAPVVAPGGAPGDWQAILAKRDAEITVLQRENAALLQEVHLLKYGTKLAPDGGVAAAPEPEAAGSDYELVIGRIRNKVERVTNLANLETLHTDSSDSDDDALFEDALSLFGDGAAADDWSDEEEGRRRTDLYTGDSPPRFAGDASSRAHASHETTQWHGPPGAYRTGSFVTTAARCDVTDLEPNTACDSWAELWNLRIGPNYKKTGAKAPSAASLYEFHSMDLLTTEDVIVGIGHHMQLPGVNFPTNNLPPVFILNISMPFNESPNMWSPQMHGKMLNVVLVYKITQSTAEAAGNLATASPAIRLWEQYVREAPAFTGDTCGIRGRMKIMAKVDQGLPRMFQRYNGKPTLLSKSSRVAQADHFFESACPLLMCG